jgi:tetratricopeptide (TPR) repeat protein
MRKILFFLFIVLPLVCLSQKEDILSYDACKDDISATCIKQYKQAFQLFKDKKYQKSTSILKNIINNQPNFASAYFLMGIIGVNLDNTTMIEKYFPLVIENCPEFSHPLLFYYLGMIDYTEERYEKAQKDFEEFLQRSETINMYDSLQNVAINYIDWSDFLHKTLENKVDFSPKKIDYLAENMNYYEPFITWDNKEIYFIRSEISRDTNKDSFISSVSSTMKYVFCVSRLDSNGNYDRGFFEDLPFNSGKREGRVSITPDNNLLFFSKLNDETDNKTWDIYYCEKFDGYWSEAKQINIDTKTFDEFSPSVSVDGSTLYFTSNRTGGKGGYDIWYSLRQKDGSWSNPINMGNNINTFLDESEPFIAADNESFYFISNGWKTIGKSDIFYSNLTNNKKPVNIGYPINSEENERSIGVMIDGKTAYSTFKNQDNNYFEINTFSLPDDVRSKKMYLLNGHINTDESELNLNLQLIDITDNKLLSYALPKNQKNFTLTLAMNKRYLAFFNNLGYCFTSKIINNEKDSLMIDVIPIDSQKKIQINDISLDSRSNDFENESAMILDKFVTFLKLNSHIRITIFANQVFGKKIEEYLIKSGIRDDRFSISFSSSPYVFYQIN